MFNMSGKSRGPAKNNEDDKENAARTEIRENLITLGTPSLPVQLVQIRENLKRVCFDLDQNFVQKAHISMIRFDSNNAAPTHPPGVKG